MSLIDTLHALEPFVSALEPFRQAVGATLGPIDVESITGYPLKAGQYPMVRLRRV